VPYARINYSNKFHFSYLFTALTSAEFSLFGFKSEIVHSFDIEKISKFSMKIEKNKQTNT
jgi:hypothetical protein